MTQESVRGGLRIATLQNEEDRVVLFHRPEDPVAGAPQRVEGKSIADEGDGGSQWLVRCRGEDDLVKTSIALVHAI